MRKKCENLKFHLHLVLKFQNLFQLFRSQNIMNEQKKKTKGKAWPNFGSKAAKESKLLRNPPKQIKGLHTQQSQTSSNQQQKKKINKADIGNPVPISVPKKFAVRVEDLLEGIEPQIVTNSKPLNNNSKKEEKNVINHEDPYTSCSECGYQSLCGSYCSCSMSGISESTNHNRLNTNQDFLELYYFVY